MNFEVIVTCAVTGAGDTKTKNPHVPVTPEEVAAALKIGAMGTLLTGSANNKMATSSSRPISRS